MMKEIGTNFENLVEIMAKLRAPDGCPWDKEQTHQSLRQYLIEEAYEVLEALDEDDHKNLKEELGDLLLQIIFHAQIASENSTFTILNVIEAITDKLIRRHPNVFGNVEIKTAEEQSINWEQIKRAEGKSSVIDGVPKALSALLRAVRIQQKAATVGFDWQTPSPVWDKVYEELEEFKNAFNQKDNDKIEDEFGDFLFSLVNLSRFLKINPENALRRTIDKFTQRFKKLEHHFEKNGKKLNEASLAEMDKIWEKIKSHE